MRSEFIHSYGYSVKLPDRCCENCIFHSIGINNDHWCKLMESKFTYANKKPWTQVINMSKVHLCGKCSRWLPQDILRTFLDSSSFEEFRLKCSVMYDNLNTEIFDEWFAERKTTDKMTVLVQNIINSFSDEYSEVLIPRVCNKLNITRKDIEFKLMEIPLMISPSDISESISYSNHSQLSLLNTGISTSFYSIHKWISDIKPIYDEYLTFRAQLIMLRKQQPDDRVWHCHGLISDSEFSYPNSEQDWPMNYNTASSFDDIRLQMI